MIPVRILVVDDSIVIRKLLSDTLSGDRALEVVATASDGRIALAKIPLLKPYLITLDIEMPVMNGLETLAAVRKLYPKLPVIMFSTLTEHGAAATLDALSLGASDYATKPSNTGNPAVAIERIRAELIPKIKALCGVAPLKLLPLPGSRPVVKPRVRSNVRIDIVAIGTSTGGPNALAEVLPRIGNDFPVPIVVVQHMPPIFTRLLAERLASRSNIPVEEGSAGTILESGHAWIDPRRHGRAPEPESGTSGEFLPPGRRCAVSLGGCGLCGERSRGRDDRDGLGRCAGVAADSRRGRRSHHPGRGVFSSLGNAWTGARLRAG
jgi:two-component system chemotaxis response regulator CheB